MPSKSATQEIYIDYDTERFIEGEAFDYEEAAKVHAEFCQIREELRLKQKQQGGIDAEQIKKTTC